MIILIDISLISKPPIYVPAATLRRTEQRDIYRRGHLLYGIIEFYYSQEQ